MLAMLHFFVFWQSHSFTQLACALLPLKAYCVLPVRLSFRSTPSRCKHICKNYTARVCAVISWFVSAYRLPPFVFLSPFRLSTPSIPVPLLCTRMNRRAVGRCRFVPTPVQYSTVLYNTVQQCTTLYFVVVLCT